MICSNILLYFAVTCALCGVVSAVLITTSLERRGIPTSFLFMRFWIFKYIAQYREITLQETGKVGPLFYSFIISMNLALVATIVGLAIR